MMSRFPSDSDVRQTYWGPPDKPQSGDEWYANISPDISDPEVIENAKLIVDACMPQNWSGQYGLFYYSFLHREFLLNQLLYGWIETGAFPSGFVCISDEVSMRPVGDTGWSSFSSRKNGRKYAPSKWI